MSLPHLSALPLPSPAQLTYSRTYQISHYCPKHSRNHRGFNFLLPIYGAFGTRYAKEKLSVNQRTRLMTRQPQPHMQYPAPPRGLSIQRRRARIRMEGPVNPPIFLRRSTLRRESRSKLHAQVASSLPFLYHSFSLSLSL